jgi:ubiquinone/menaquinone biosynthesis C-methylase UbiE
MASDRRSTRRTTHHTARNVLYGLAVVHVLEALALRRRRESIVALPPVEPGQAADTGKVDIVSIPGAAVDEGTRAAARQEMDLTGVKLVDLIPGDLPVDRWLRMLRRVDTGNVGTNPILTPGGANEALALHPSLAERLGTDGDETLDRGEMVRRTKRAQRYAPGAVSLRLAPGAKAPPSNPQDRWRELEEATAFTYPYGRWAPLLVGLETAHLLAMTAGLVVSPAAALAALATWSAQPALVLGGADEEAQPFTAPGFGQASLLRLPLAWADNVRTTVAGYHATRTRAAERAATPVPPVPTTEELFEPRRDTCAWCGSGSLVDRLDITDLLQHKPGTFHLDECTDCGHIFQNPALTIRGLDYYYEHAYDGIGEEMTEFSFSGLGKNYRSRVESMARFHEPRALLDVGTGHGHFLLAARERWPEATFDALDMSDSVYEAKRRGWADTAYLGQFPDLADGLPRSYDAMTMHHYLEHTRDPRRELAAAAKVLEPGGYLMIEMPDAQHKGARTFGRFWWQWGQPQHQHFITCDNLVAALEEGGFEVVSVERGPVTLGGDLLNAVALGLQNVARSPHLPWLAAPSLGYRIKRIAIWTAALPALIAAKIADEIVYARHDPDEASNTYRLVARRV